MRFIIPYINDALFKGADEGNWRGRIQAVGDGRECVPVVFNYERYFIEFEKSSWLRGNCNFEDSLYKDHEGDYFLPKMDHRVISIWAGVNRQMEDVKQLCAVDPNQATLQTSEFSALLVEAVMDYFSSYPNVDQYFFESEPGFRQLLERQISLHAAPGIVVSWLNQLAAPHYGFSLKKSNDF